MKSYTNLQEDAGDIIRDASWVSANPEKVLRCANRALADINLGETGEEHQLTFAYDFQKEIQDIVFSIDSTGTITTTGTTTLIDNTATFQTDNIAVGDDVENTTDGSIARVVSVDSQTQITTSALKNGTDNTFTSGDSYKIKGVNYRINPTWNYKFTSRLRLAQDHNREFTFVSQDFFESHKYIADSGQYMFTIDFQNGTQLIKINNNSDENLNLEFYSYNIVLNTDGTTRQTTFANDGDTVLIPNEHYYTLVELTSAYIYQQMNGEDSIEFKTHLELGRQKLKKMMNSIGIFQKTPEVRLKTRSEWYRRYNIVSNE